MLDPKMHTPDLRSLNVFVAVADAGGLKGAAERLGRAQSALSMTLKSLENFFGAPLFEPDRRGKLTPLGMLVLDESRELLRNYKSSIATVQSFARNQIGHCDVGSITSVAVSLLPHAIAGVRKDIPGFGVDLRQIDSRNAIAAVIDGSVDMAFTTLASIPDELQFEPLFEDRIDVVCSFDDPLVLEKQPIEWDALKQRIVIRNDSFHFLQTPSLLEVIEQSHTSVSNTGAVLAAVRAGLGVSILPRLCSVLGAESLCFVEVADPEALRIVGMLSKRGQRQLEGARLLARAMRTTIRGRAAELGYHALI